MNAIVNTHSSKIQEDLIHEAPVSFAVCICACGGLMFVMVLLRLAEDGW